MLDVTTVVVRAAAGDQLAWEDLVQRYNGPLRAIASGFRLTSSDIEDALQMTWLGLFQQVKELRSPDRVGSWLSTTMRRNCIRLLQRRQREHLSDDCAKWALVDTSATAESRVLLAERDRTLWQLVDRLPAGQRRLVRALFASPEQSYSQVATELSIAVGTIGPARQRALRKLESLLVKAGIHERDAE